jgi:hypothetical protein
MINYPLNFSLPDPWKNTTFNTQKIGAINFLVGPNGSGKSRFAMTLKSIFPNARLLSTDRLSGMEGEGGIRNIIGDHFAGGFAKSMFGNLKNSGLNFGSGMDTLVLLEERLDLRIQVEATLSHLFNRKIKLERDSGNLVARATLGSTGTSYRLDREECHGIKELLVLLTHLYNDEHKYLIIDEPELNLHPQYQAFLIQEIRRVAGDPSIDPSKKVVFLITHSPFILDFRSVEDIKCVISFSLRHESPKHIFDLSDAETTRLATLVPRLNVHHKQLFFSDNPIFVEGIFDAQLVETIQTVRGVSTAAAGSCVIDVGGCEEVNRYLELSNQFGKKAFFLYDLDSLFNGNLRACLRSDGTIQNFLATLGVGSDFSRYCGQLDSELTSLIDKILISANAPPLLLPLVKFLNGLGERKLWEPGRFAKGRVAVLTAISLYREEVISLSSSVEVINIEGRLKQISSALRQCNVFLLSRGALELYMPSYTGDPYVIPPDSKNPALTAEIEILASGMSNQEMRSRYGELHEIICDLPSKAKVDINSVLKEHLGSYIHDLQGLIQDNPKWSVTELSSAMTVQRSSSARVFSICSFQRSADEKFTAVVRIIPMLGQVAMKVVVTEKTNAGMREFLIDPFDTPSITVFQPTGSVVAY